MGIDPAYAAGIFDGEGCVYFTRIRQSYVLNVIITNTDLPLLEALKRTFGGNITGKSRAHKGWKQAYQLRLSWSRAVKFLALIQPWVIVKSQQIGVAFAWDAIRPGRGVGRGAKNQARLAEYHEGSEFLRRQLMWLNKRGSDDKGMSPVDEVLLDMPWPPNLKSQKRK